MGIFIPSLVPQNGPEEAPQQGAPPVTTGGFFFYAYPCLGASLPLLERVDDAGGMSVSERMDPTHGRV